MIRRVEVSGLGPHEDTKIDIDPKGATRIAGRSQSGKSTLMDAVCFALWGRDRHGAPLPVEAVREGCDAARVMVELGSGTRIERVMRINGKGNRMAPIRTIAPRGEEPVGYRTEDQFRAAIRQLGADEEAIRCALVPMAWLPLHDGEGSGRPLRDLLARVLPRVDAAGVVAELMRKAGEAFRRGDPISEADAAALMTRANKAAIKTEADRDAAARDLARLEEKPAPECPTGAEVEAARALLDAAAAWDKVGPKIDAARERQAQIKAATAAAAEWDRRRAALGDEPEGDSGLDAARAEATAANKAFADLDDAAHRLRGQLEQARRDAEPRPIDIRDAEAKLARARAKAQAAQADADAVSDVCPTCKRGGWVERQAEMRAAAKAADEAAYAANDAALLAREEANEAEAKRQAEACERAEALERELSEVEAKRAEAEQRKEAARDAVAAARAASQPAAEWHATIRGLGARPVVPDPIEAPELPSAPRPHAGDASKARASIEQARHAAGQLKERQSEIELKRAALEQAARAHEAAKAEQRRIKALVEAIRQEPNVSLRRQLDQLGDLGPVEIRLRDSAGGVDLYVDGRPWRWSSTGRQVVADVWFRDALRRAMRLRWLCIFIDCTQDVGGQELPAPTPCVLLTTTDDEQLTVTT